MSTLTDQDAQHIASELRSRRSTTKKRNLRPRQPLKAQLKSITGDITSQDLELKRTALQQALQVLDLLPPNSTYAKHRRATVQKALDLLNAERSEQLLMDHMHNVHVVSQCGPYTMSCWLAGPQHKSLNWNSCWKTLTSNHPDSLASAPCACLWLQASCCRLQKSSHSRHASSGWVTPCVSACICSPHICKCSA